MPCGSRAPSSSAATRAASTRARWPASREGPPLVEVAIALGIVVGLLAGELLGVTAAGLVVPGYLALHLDQPVRVGATCALALATWAVVRFGIARVVVLYGRRRLAVAVLVGLVLNVLAERLLLSLPPQPLDARVIGHIVPGLVAGEALGQGFVRTVAATLLVAAAVRLLLFLVLPWMP